MFPQRDHDPEAKENPPLLPVFEKLEETSVYREVQFSFLC
jgi:hypothetical protein